MKKRKLQGNIARLLALLLVSMFLVGCGAPSDWATDDVAPAAAPEESPVMEDAADDWDWADEAPSAAEADEAPSAPAPGGDRVSNIPEEEPEPEGTMGPLPILLPSDSGRQLVYSTYINIQTMEFMAGVRLINEQTAALAGYSSLVIVNGRHMLRENQQRDATFELRIPTEHLAEFITFVEDHYNIVRLEKRMVDYTVSYERDMAHLEDLREQEQRLQDDLDDEKLEDDEATRDQLSEVREQIRDLEAATSELERDVIYSDVSIRLYEVIVVEILEEVEEEEEEEEEIPPTFSERLRDTMNESSSGFLAVVQVIVLILVAMLPWLLAIGAMAVVIVFLLKRSKKRKNAKDDDAPPPPSTKPPTGPPANQVTAPPAGPPTNAVNSPNVSAPQNGVGQDSNQR